MPVEQANFVNQLKPTQPAGGESISEGDDHLRAIKTALVESFPEIGARVTASSAELNKVGQMSTDLDSLKTDFNDLDKTAHGNVASCYWNPSFSSGKLAYSHNVADVIPNPTDQTGMQTRIVFTPGALDGNPHYAFNLTPVNGTGQATNITVVGVADDHLAFLSWHLVGGVWTPIPGAQLGFSLMVTDMEAGQ